MKQFEKQKSIGWFKLAEYIERGEKERALGIYKLLALSIDNQAFNYQLEGDILLAFQDHQAKEKYLQAVDLYLKQNQIDAAVGMLQHLVLLEVDNHSYLKQLNEIYLKYLPDKIIIQIRNLLNFAELALVKEYLQQFVQEQLTNQNQELIFKLISELKEFNPELASFVENNV